MKIESIFDQIERIIVVLIVIAFMTMVISLSYQIISRYIFDKGNAWTEELTRYTFVWLVMLSSSVALRRSKHMKVDFTNRTLSKTINDVKFWISNILVIIFLSVLTFYGLQLVSLTQRQLSSGMQIPMSYIYLAIPVGGILMLLFTVESCFNSKRKGI